MNVLTSDFECLTYEKGNPYSTRGGAVCVGMKRDNECTDVYFDWNLDPQGYDLYVFFNAKFDLSWWRKCGQDISGWRIWDVQVAEFLLEGQSSPYPSLDDTSVKYGGILKLDVVSTEWWDRGFNTDAIPRNILSEYCARDVDITYECYLKQVEQFKEHSKLYQTFKIWMEDLKVLQEIEWNGQIYDEDICRQRAGEIEQRLQEITTELETTYSDVPINFNSGPQLSAFLYGGTISELTRVPDGMFKTGARKGEVRYRNVIVEHQLPRLVEPLRNSAMAKEGVFATDEGTLRKLKGPNAKRYVGKLLELSRLEKLLTTYYRGIPKINEEMHWPKGEVHGQYNQVMAATARLSSSRPNLQNQAGEILDVYISRYRVST